MSADIVFVSVEEAVRLHAFVMGIEPERGASNVMDIGLLDSALSRPRQLHFYEDADLSALAATLLWGVVKNHAFYDGNKRTGWLITRVLLYRNGYDIPNDARSVRLVLNIASGKRSVEQVERWIRVRLEPARQLWLFEDD